jgi:hypothetical protein
MLSIIITLDVLVGGLLVVVSLKVFFVRFEALR